MGSHSKIQITRAALKRKDAMSNQVAKLFLRGKLMTKTAKNLTPIELKEVEKYCQIVWDDPAMARTKTTFCSKLAWTIGNEYLDLETAMQEVMVVYWKTTVDILFHKPKQEMQSLIEATCAKCNNIKTIKCNPCDETGFYSAGKCDSCYGRGYAKTAPDMPCGCGSSATLDLTHDLFSMGLEEAREVYKSITKKEPPHRDLSLIENPLQRHKFYKTTLWTYLRQIMNENKPHAHKAASAIKDYAEKVALTITREIISQSIKKFHEVTKEATEGSGKRWIKERMNEFADGYAIIEANTNLLSMDGVRRLRELQDMMISNNVEIVSKDTHITIRKIGNTSVIVANVRKESHVNFLSIAAPDEESPKNNTYLYPNVFVETIAPPTTISEVETQDGLSVVRRKLNPTAQRVFDLILSPPDEFSNVYSVNPVRRSNVSKFLNLSKSEVDAAWEKIQQATIAAGLR